MEWKGGGEFGMLQTSPTLLLSSARVCAQEYLSPHDHNFFWPVPHPRIIHIIHVPQPRGMPRNGRKAAAEPAAERPGTRRRAGAEQSLPRWGELMRRIAQ